MPVAAPRPASKGEPEQATALERAAAPSYQNIMSAFIKSSDQPVRFYTVYRLLMVASHRGVDVSWQGCAPADSSFRTSWAGGTQRKAVRSSSLGAPDKQFILFADNLHGQTTDDFKSVITQQCNTMPWLLPDGCTDETQPIDAGYGRLFMVHVGKALDKWLLDADHVEL